MLSEKQTTAVAARSRSALRNNIDSVDEKSGSTFQNLINCRLSQKSRQMIEEVGTPPKVKEPVNMNRSQSAIEPTYKPESH
jgi:hypothetical protein